MPETFEMVNRPHYVYSREIINAHSGFPKGDYDENFLLFATNDYKTEKDRQYATNFFELGQRIIDSMDYND